MTARKPIQAVPEFCPEFTPENVYESQTVQKLSNTFIRYNGCSVSVAYKLHKFPGKRMTLQVPQCDPLETAACFQDLLLCASQIPQKNSPNRKISHSSCENPGKGTFPPCSPKQGPYGNRRPFP